MYGSVQYIVEMFSRCSVGGVLHCLLPCSFFHWFIQFAAMHIVQKFSVVQCPVMRFACAAAATVEAAVVAATDAFVKWSERECWLIPPPTCLHTNYSGCSPAVHLIQHCGGRLILPARLLLAPTSLIPSLASVTLSCSLTGCKVLKWCFPQF